jgi:hypothetical protein
VNEGEGDDFPLGVSGFTFADLYQPRRLRELHRAFWEFASSRNPDITARFQTVADEAITGPSVSEVLIDVANLFGAFVTQLFQIGPEVDRLADDTRSYEKIFQFKQDFLKARVFKHFGKSTVDDSQFEKIDAEVQRLLALVPPASDPEIHFSDAVLTLLAAEKSLTANPDEADTVPRRRCPTGFNRRWRH